MKYKGIVCEKCGVEVTVSKVRRERMGQIQRRPLRPTPPADVLQAGGEHGDARVVEHRERGQGQPIGQRLGRCPAWPGRLPESRRGGRRRRTRTSSSRSGGLQVVRLLGRAGPGDHGHQVLRCPRATRGSTATSCMARPGSVVGQRLGSQAGEQRPARPARWRPRRPRRRRVARAQARDGRRAWPGPGRPRTRGSGARPRVWRHLRLGSVPHLPDEGRREYPNAGLAPPGPPRCPARRRARCTYHWMPLRPSSLPTAEGLGVK